MTASASGTALSTTDGNAVTGYSSTTSDTFVKSYPGATSKMVTASFFNSATVSNETLSFGTGTAATGSLSGSGSGASVMTGLGTAVTASGLTGLGTASTAKFLKTASVSSQPTITLTENDTEATGSVKYAKDIATSGTNNVTFVTSGKTADAITALPASTVPAYAATTKYIKLSTSSETVVKDIGTATAAAQTFTGTSETYDVDPKSST